MFYMRFLLIEPIRCLYIITSFIGDNLRRFLEATKVAIFLNFLLTPKIILQTSCHCINNIHHFKRLIWSLVQYPHDAIIHSSSSENLPLSIFNLALFSYTPETSAGFWSFAKHTGEVVGWDGVSFFSSPFLPFPFIFLHLHNSNSSAWSTPRLLRLSSLLVWYIYQIIYYVMIEM